MIAYSYIATAACSGLLVLATGCGRKTETEAKPPEAGVVWTQAPATVTAAKDSVPLAVTTAPPPAETAKAMVTNAVTNSPATTQEIIDTAKRLVAENKWQELAQTLGKLQGQTLTPEQEKALLDLKGQLDKMVRDALGK
jgi:hypothetical protein